MTIKYAFEQAGIWPIDSSKVLQKMSKYMKEATPEPLALPNFPPIQRRSTHVTFGNLERGLQIGTLSVVFTSKGNHKCRGTFVVAVLRAHTCCI
jgi:hypothetical protein